MPQSFIFIHKDSDVLSQYFCDKWIMLIGFQRLEVALVVAQMFCAAYISSEEFLSTWNIDHSRWVKVKRIKKSKDNQKKNKKTIPFPLFNRAEPAAVQLAASSSPAWDTNQQPLIDLHPWLIPSHCSLNDANYSPSRRSGAQTRRKYPFLITRTSSLTWNWRLASDQGSSCHSLRGSIGRARASEQQFTGGRSEKGFCVSWPGSSLDSW